MTLLDVSQKLFGSKGNSYDSQSLGGSDNADASVVYGEAVVDASSGEVSVLIDGTAIDNDPDSPDYQMGDYITCDTDELIQAGDRVTVIRNGQNLKAMAISPDTLGVTAAITAANQAQAVANAVNQHFWYRSTDPNGDGAGTGAFVTDEEQDDFLTAAASGFADYDPSTKPYRNVLMNSLGFLIREALHNLASFTQSAVSFFDGSGNVTASFGSGGAVVGMVADGQSRTEIASGGLHVYQRENGADVAIADLGYGYGYDSGGLLVENPYYTFGYRAAGSQIGNYSVCEGIGCTASGWTAHAEGIYSGATYIGSHAEGSNTIASGYTAHAEGYDSLASGFAAHTEGYSSTATGDYSHAQNRGTRAASEAQTAMGRFNVADSADTYALIVGNGTDANNRSNAFTVAWNGDVEIAGSLTQAKDTSWAYLVGNSSSTNYVRWRCKSGWVIAEANYSSGASIPASGGNKTFGTIPSGYRPSKTVTVGATVSSNNVASMWVMDGGSVQGNQRGSSSSSTFFGSVTYPID